jgi:UDP-MurNAc hydroxylase
MRLTNLGGATAIVEHGGKRMLMDPWLDDGIFHGAWYHCPPMNFSLERLGRFDYVYISHIHEDHCSAGTIRHINPDAEVIIADKNPNFVERFLNTHGFRFAKVHKVKPHAPTWIAPDMLVDVIEADPANEMAFSVDSALVLRWGDTTLYNANDCQPYRGGIDYIKSNYRLDLALLPYSGGSGYPSCYVNLDDAHKAQRAAQIRAARLENFYAVAEELGATWTMPFADQYVVAGSRSHLNRFISHSSCPGVVRDGFADKVSRSRLLLLNSGQSFDVGQQQIQPDEPYRFFTEEDRETYIQEQLLDKRYDHEMFALNPGVSLARLVRHARQRLWDYQGRRKSFPNWNVYLDIPERGERYLLPLGSEQVTDLDTRSELTGRYLRIAMPATLAALVLIGHVSINIADAALFLDYERSPDVYEPELYVLLNMLRC